MKKLLSIFCIVSLLTIFFPSAMAAAPVISVQNDRMTVTYDNPNAKGKYTYVLLDMAEHISLVEIDAGDTWSTTLTDEGFFKVKVYFKDKNGVTHSEESDFQEVRFIKQVSPLNPDDFANDTDPLPSVFTNPVVYNEPTPMPTQSPVYQPGALLYTLAPSQSYYTPSTPAPAATSPAVPTVTFPGTRPCFEHLNIRIRIADNDGHVATKGRSGPGTDMPQVATLNVGEVYQVLDCRILEPGNVHWFMVTKNGVTCWVASGRCERY